MGTVLVLGVAAGAAVIVARSSQGDHTDLFDAATGAGGSATTTGDSSQVATTPTSRPPTVTDPLPPDGSVAFMVGQDSSTLGLLRLEAPSLPEPYGVVLNVGLAPPASMLAGVPPAGTVGLPSSAATLDVAAGITDVATTLADYPDSALVLGLSLADGTCSNDVALALVGQPTTGAQASTQGDLFSAIDRMSAYFAGLAPRAVYLKIGYEFEGGWNCYFPSLYVQAYRVVAERVAAIAPDVQFVWQAAAHPRADFAPPSDHVEGEIPLATLRDYRFNGQADPAAGFPATDPGFGQGVLNAWYPGDDVVDWVGFSYVGGSNFSAQWGPVVTSYSPRDQQQAVLAFAREHAKPVMIGQASPLGYDLAQ
ncbi:MAG: hypothetical protein OEY23_14365, partial [Acidimicrobiia bacterium]|nr:hypothetical protein [Acidimicrobiia bacterium]